MLPIISISNIISTTWLLATDVLYGEWNPVNDLLVK